MADVPFEPREEVRIGLAGAGNRQRGLLRNLLHVESARVVAVHDAAPSAVEAVLALVAAAGAPPPTVAAELGELLAHDDVDVVCVATPWDQHAPMAVAAMEAGKHVWVEVPAAVTIEGCWALVDASERTRRHCVMLENCCYGDNELLVLNMVRAGMLGELLHGEAAYIHDLRDALFTRVPWRRRAHVERDGNLYPTHGLGPIASYMGVNRGDRLDSLVSMSSPQLGLERWRAAHVAEDDASWRETYRCGDINTSIVRTARGRTILVQHTVVTPHPYDRLNAVAGTAGVFRDYPARIYLDGQPGGEEYTGIEPYRARFEHELWRTHGDLARRLGEHGGMDFVMLRRLVDVMRAGAAPDMDVYDAAAWSAVGPLSDASVANGGAPVDVPDFTRGRGTSERRLPF